VDEIHLKVRMHQEKLSLLVILGVRARGRKELVAITDGHLESSESWADLLRDSKRRGMTARCWPSAMVTPVLKAIREVCSPPPMNNARVCLRGSA
jgi:hypothetical protein